MAFITVEDLYGSTEIIVFDSCYSKSQHVLLEENVVLIDGRLSIREDEPVKIVANNITEFNETKGARPLLSQNQYSNANNVGADDPVRPNNNNRPKILLLNITNASETQKDKLRGAIRFFSGDKNNIAVQVNDNGQIKPCGAIYLNQEILEQFKEVLGEKNVSVVMGS